MIDYWSLELCDVVYPRDLMAVVAIAAAFSVLWNLLWLAARLVIWRIWG